MMNTRGSKLRRIPKGTAWGSYDPNVGLKDTVGGDGWPSRITAAGY